MNSNSRWVVGLSKAAAVAPSMSRPLLLFTSGAPAPVSQNSTIHGCMFQTKGWSEIPASLMARAASASSSRVWGGSSGSRPAASKWSRL